MAGRQHVEPNRSRSRFGHLAIKAPGPLGDEARDLAVLRHRTKEVLLVPVPKQVVGAHRKTSRQRLRELGKELRACEMCARAHPCCTHQDWGQGAGSRTPFAAILARARTSSSWSRATRISATA